MRKLFFLVTAAVFFSSSRAQDLNIARQTIAKLASRELAGRGYVNQGCQKAADFIVHAFDSIGLLPSNKNFTQPFSFPVNTFPGRMKVTVDGIKLLPGHDFLVHPFSAGSHKGFRLKPLNSYSSPGIFNDNPGTCYTVWQDSLPENERLLLIGDLLSGKIKSGALLFLQKKLTWSVAGGHYAIPVISILQHKYPEHATEIKLAISQKFLPAFSAQNILGYIEGAERPDSFIVFSAHYDHLGMMGKETFFPGANDNASGVAMLLNLAAHYSGKANRPGCSMVFIAFAGEEAGLVGSKYYTGNPIFPLSRIKFLINLDLLGTGEEGMMVVNATEHPEQFHLLDSINSAHAYLPKLGQRGKAKNSDHYYFSEQGVPSFFFYTMGGIQAYHDVNDKAETLPLTEFEDTFRLIERFVTVID